MSVQLTEQTEVLKDRVRPAEGYPGRYIIPVVVANQSMATGPWARRAAEGYARSELRLTEPACVVPPPGISRPYPAYINNETLPHHLGRTSIEDFRKVAAADAATRAETPDPRWVIEIHVDGGA